MRRPLPVRGPSGASRHGALAGLAALAILALAIHSTGRFTGASALRAGQPASVQAPPKRADATILVGWQVDGSLPVSARRRLVGLFKQAYDRVLPDRSRIMMWGFSGASWRIYDGVPDAWTTLLLPLRQQVLAGDGPSNAAASPCEMLHEMTRTARRAGAGGQRTALILCTNGAFSDYGAARDCARELAAEPALRAAWVVGIQPDPGRGEELRRRIASVFGPLADRLVVSGEFDATSGLDRFAERFRR